MNQLNKQKDINSVLLEEIENKYILQKDVICYLQKEIEVIHNFQKFKSYLDENKSKKNLLIYRYTNSICEGCIQDDLTNLEEFLPEIGKESILILPSIKETRESKIHLRNQLGKFNYWNIPLEDFKMPLDCENKVEQRFFFLLNEKREIISIFFPQQGNSHFTQEFFQHVKDYINQ
ncbi:hypothetical protein [Parabacteroides pacaensis]|uniref:hypothetical protein n=1 Tax=Parabacteroides pacaensis TaxID=2086575 RepID=UPI00131CF9F8|nr:hypothetical protein [Parabacteroides pacaensis]